MLCPYICPVDGVAHRNIGFRLFVHRFRLAFWSIKSFEKKSYLFNTYLSSVLKLCRDKYHGHSGPAVHPVWSLRCFDLRRVFESIKQLLHVTTKWNIKFSSLKSETCYHVKLNFTLSDKRNSTRASTAGRSTSSVCGRCPSRNFANLECSLAGKSDIFPRCLLTAAMRVTALFFLSPPGMLMSHCSLCHRAR